MKKTLKFAALLWLLYTGTIKAQDDVQIYQKPPQAIADIISAPSTPTISLSPDYSRYIISEMIGLPSIRETAQEVLSLAGIRILPAINGHVRVGKIRSLWVYAVDASPAGLAKSKIVQGQITGLPDYPILEFSYDPTGRRVAITVETDNAIECWVADLSNLVAYKATSKRLNDFFFGMSPIWTPDGNSLILFTIPSRTSVPAPDRTPKGPIVQTSDGTASGVRTFQHLLVDSYSEALFDYYAPSELTKIDIQNKTEQLLAPKGIYTSVNLSPDGNYFLATTLHRPYSYAVPYYWFPTKLAVWSIDGEQISVLDETALRRSLVMKNGTVLPGKREFSWRADKPATIYWVEALDGGDIRKEVDKRDEVWMLDAPFTAGTAYSFMKTDLRFDGITWGNDRNAVLTTQDHAKKMRYSYLFDPTKPESMKFMFSLFAEDIYSDPGNMILTPLYGTIYSHDNFKTIYFSGAGYGAEGARPFIDRYTIATGKTQRIWQCEANYFERPRAYLDLNAGNIITVRESTTEWPNFYILNIKNKKRTALTNFPDPSAMIAGVTKQVVTYQRQDGIPLQGTLYLPAGYKKEDGPLPVLLKAYPKEFQSASGAGQRRDSPHTYIRVSRSGIVTFVTQGYAIFDDASFPIVGEEGVEPNDTFIEQLIMNAEAAINTLTAMGVGDPKRIAVTGHSYGAFMTANLLAHSSLFAAGIACTGGYNRSLTPFGFQNERRTFWDDPNLYVRMSPFTYANKIKSPILFIHGLADTNSGTIPMQSERMFAAVQGNGGIARLVMLPTEGHSYSGCEESLMHVCWEMLQWLDKYVKNAK